MAAEPVEMDHFVPEPVISEPVISEPSVSEHLISAAPIPSVPFVTGLKPSVDVGVQDDLPQSSQFQDLTDRVKNLDFLIYLISYSFYHT